MERLSGSLWVTPSWGLSPSRLDPESSSSDERPLPGEGRMCPGTQAGCWQMQTPPLSPPHPTAPAWHSELLLLRVCFHACAPAAWGAHKPPACLPSWWRRRAEMLLPGSKPRAHPQGQGCVKRGCQEIRQRWSVGARGDLVTREGEGLPKGSVACEHRPEGGGEAATRGGALE